MFIHNINPVFIHVGPVEIRYYGLVYFIGFLFLYFFFRQLIKKDKLKSINLETLDLFLIYLMLGGILGGRIFDFIFFNTKILWTNPLEILKIWHGGMSIHGGLIGAFVAVYIFSKKYKARFYELTDATVIPLMFFLGIGRIANFLNGELWGTLSNSSLCVDYSKSQYIYAPPLGCRHPYVLYESLKNFAVAGILLAFKAKAKLKEGLLFWYGMLMYNFFRFFIDIYRDGGEPRLFLGLTMTQYLCIAFTIVSVIMIILMSRKEKNTQEEKGAKEEKKELINENGTKNGKKNGKNGKKKL
jgi:phosphatidylglycerol---prolipoprotein diacylglyceryl transferase